MRKINIPALNIRTNNKLNEINIKKTENQRNQFTTESRVTINNKNESDFKVITDLNFIEETNNFRLKKFGDYPDNSINNLRKPVSRNYISNLSRYNNPIKNTINSSNSNTNLNRNLYGSSSLIQGTSNKKSEMNSNIINNSNIITNSAIKNTEKNQTSTAGRKFRKGFSTAWKNSNYVEQEYAVSIIENYSREVGISAFNFRTMEIFITQFIDNEAYVNSITMINFWRPLELIMNQKSENSCLHLLSKKFFNNCYISLIPRKFFVEDIGKDIYLKSGVGELSMEEINTKYVCMASLSGLISYLEQNSNTFIEKEYLSIKFHYLENHLNISFQSTIDLELLLNNKFNKSFGSLFSLFNCLTVSGSRLLRSNILQPLAIKEDINKRYQAVDELNNNPDILFQIKEQLSLFKDLEVSITKFMHRIEEPTENIIKQILSSIQNVRLSLKALKNFKDIIKFKLKSDLFLTISKCFDDKIYEYMLENIENLIEEFDFTNIKITRKQDSIFFMIKSGINNILDVSRKTYSDTINEIFLEFEKLKISTNDPNIKLLYSESKGYYVVLSEKYYNQDEYVVTKKIGKKYNCSNIALISLSERIKEIKRDLIDISMNLIIDIVKIIQKNINYLYVLSSYIALIDVLCSFSEFSKLNIKTTKPFIANSKNFPVVNCKNCRHPLYEKNVFLLNKHQGNNYNFYVPNDYFFTNHFNILLLKGANASGKSTYMKQLAILTIMAQIGCFVPSDYFEFTLRKFIYTKFDSNDNMEENKGTFIKEITEIQKVVSNHLNDSLILLDEPFDNSDSKENLALSFAVLDQFTSKVNRSFIIISSHNHSLTQLSSFYFNIIIGTMVVEFSDDVMEFLYKFKFNNPVYKDNFYPFNTMPVNNIETYNKEENYGIILADMMGFNKEIINKAKEFSLASHNNSHIHKLIEKSDNISYLKTFIFKLLYDFYDLNYISNCYVIEEEVLLKKKEIQQFIKNCIN